MIAWQNWQKGHAGGGNAVELTPTQHTAPQAEGLRVLPSIAIPVEATTLGSPLAVSCLPRLPTRSSWATSPALLLLAVIVPPVVVNSWLRIGSHAWNVAAAGLCVCRPDSLLTQQYRWFARRNPARITEGATR